MHDFMAVIKRFFKAIGKIVAAPFMGYVWMARCKNLLVENARLSTRVSKLEREASTLQGNYNTQDEELRARMRRILFLANQTDRLKKQYGVQEEAALKMQADLDALHGYALDLDAQLVEAKDSYTLLADAFSDEATRIREASNHALTIISVLPCASRISKYHWKMVQTAINAISIRFTSPNAREQNELTADADPIVQA